MSGPSKQPSAEAYRALKAGLVFEYLDTNRDSKLEWGEILVFPTQLEKAGQTDLADKHRGLLQKYWTIMNQSLGRTDLRSFTKEEWVKAFTTVWNHEWYRNTFVFGLAEVFFTSIDLNHDGSISIEEWREYQKKRGMTDEAVIMSTFSKMDTNGDGKISPDEVRHAYTMFGLSDDPTEDYSFIYDCNAK